MADRNSKMSFFPDQTQPVSTPERNKSTPGLYWWEFFTLRTTIIWVTLFIHEAKKRPRHEFNSIFAKK